MDFHFRAFSFVDRITSLQPRTRITGSYAIPSGLDDFPSSLAAEAIGQLAAWAAMAAVDFKSRPVAGLAGRIDLLAPVRPGQVLDLDAELESVDEEAVAYCGSARADGTPVIRLQHCVGPMVPVADFDNPLAVRDRFALLCGPGAIPGAFIGIPSLPLERTGGDAGQCLRATLRVPVTAALFGDHFPRRPVLPGTLLMNANLQLASALAAEIPVPSGCDAWVLRTILDVKLRAFIPPGEVLEFEAELDECSDHTAVLTVETRSFDKSRAGGKRVVGSARVLLSTEECP